jgi:hypothetical protein
MHSFMKTGGHECCRMGLVVYVILYRNGTEQASIAVSETCIQDVLGFNLDQDTAYADRSFWWFSLIPAGKCRYSTVIPVSNGISRVQNIFLLKPDFRLIKVYYDSYGARKYFGLGQNSVQYSVRLRQVYCTTIGPRVVP